MKYFIIVITILFLSFGIRDENKLFQEYLSLLQQVPIPLSSWCGDKSNVPSSVKANQSKYGQFIPTDFVSGKLWLSSKFVAILYYSIGDWHYPNIYTFSNDGSRIDSVSIGVYCDGELGYKSTSHFQITVNHEIIVVDTISTKKIDSQYRIIPDTDSVFVVTKKYKINDSGRFVKSYSKKTIYP